MFGQLSHELEINVPASEAWELYGTLRLAKLLEEDGTVIQKFEVTEGDGGLGTILKFTFPPGTPGFTYYKEKFTKHDNEKRLKEAEVIEGGYLELGFTFHHTRFEIIEMDSDTCIVRTTIEYDVKEEAAANASYATIDAVAKLAEKQEKLKMFGQLSHELEVNVPASEAWELYSTLRLAKLVEEEPASGIEKIDVIEGDGGAGTILKLTFAGPPLFTVYKEKFTKLDNEKRLKETEVVEGGYLELGFTLFLIRFEVIEKDNDSCIIKSTIEYDVKEEAAANASYVTIDAVANIAELSKNYLTKNKAAKDEH